MVNYKSYSRAVLFCVILLNSTIISYAQNIDNAMSDNISTDNSTIDNTSNSNNITFDNSSFYNDNASDFYSGDDFYELEDMEITDEILNDNDVGRTVLPRVYIENAPKGNGGVTDLLRAVPSIQFDEEYRGAENAGEIAPAEISISGGKAYENLFVIDGISNSSLLDPASDNPYSTTEVTGNAQKFSVDSWIIEDITVYDSNVPTKYDGFTGGVVDVKTKRPDNEFAGSVSYRNTNSYFTYFHLDEGVTEKPQFFKNFYTASLNIPILDDWAALISYNRADSVIPQTFLDGFRSETRQSETFLIKNSYNIDGLNYIDATVSYAPSYSRHYIINTENSEFTINSGGWFAQAGYTRETGLGGVFNASLNYTYNENSRNAPNEFFPWLQSQHKPWGQYVSDTSSSNEGAWGSIDKYEQTVNVSADNVHDDIEFYGMHTISYGLDYDFVFGRENRIEDAYIYQDAVQSIDIVCGGQGGCIDGDQYFHTREVTPESDTSASLNKISLYVEDKYDIWRLDLRVGARVGYDDYLSNVNVSPRTELRYDIFDNLFTVLTVGYNRYYSSALLTYKLREGREPGYTESRWTTNNIVQDWTLTASDANVEYNFDSLKTPYTDELLASIDQEVLGGIFNVKYIERFGKDIFANERFVDSNGDINYKLNNNGTSRYRSIQAKWSRAWEKHYVMINGSWQQSSSSNDTYDDSYDLEDLENDVLFNGEVIKAYQLPEDNYNRPFVINVGYVGNFFKHLYFSTNVKFTSGYRENALLEDSYVTGTGPNDPVTGAPTFNSIPAYETVEYKPNITVDVAIEWRQPFFWGHQLSITAEVNNLFNTKNEIDTSSSISSYELGTQLWLGATYEF